MGMTDIAVDMQHAVMARTRAVTGLSGQLLRQLEGAVPCYWEWGTVTRANEVSQSYPEDAHLLRSDLLAPAQWWYLDNPQIRLLRVAGHQAAEAILVVDGAQVGHADLCYGTFFCRVFYAGRPSPIPVPMWSVSLPFNAPWRAAVTPLPIFASDHVSDKDIEHATIVARFVMSSVCWLRSTVVGVERVRTGRGSRRRLALEMDHLTRVVTLRHAAPSEPQGSREVDWACRWAVSGHWREQTVRDGHRQVWIESYIKGPPDKPFRPSTVRYKIDR